MSRLNIYILKAMECIFVVSILFGFHMLSYAGSKVKPLAPQCREVFIKQSTLLITRGGLIDRGSRQAVLLAESYMNRGNYDQAFEVLDGVTLNERGIEAKIRVLVMLHRLFEAQLAIAGLPKGEVQSLLSAQRLLALGAAEAAVDQLNEVDGYEMEKNWFLAHAYFISEEYQKSYDSLAELVAVKQDIDFFELAAILKVESKGGLKRLPLIDERVKGLSVKDLIRLLEIRDIVFVNFTPYRDIDRRYYQIKEAQF